MGYKTTLKIFSFLILFFIFHPLVFPQTLKIGERINNGVIKDKRVSEISGIAASRINHNIFWVHNDSGNKNYIYAINNDADVVAAYKLKGVRNRDWEDIAVAPGPTDKSYVYLAEIGDNKEKFKYKYIYRFEEPKIKANKSNNIITKVDKIKFKYPDGKRDAETIMVDPKKRDIYIITKREKNVNVYLLTYPQSLLKLNIPKLIGKLKSTLIVGGDISSTGNMVIIKNYNKVFYWKRKKNELLKNIFKRKPKILPYVIEAQGEGICWAANEKGYYTISEKRFLIKSHLYFYPILK